MNIPGLVVQPKAARQLDTLLAAPAHAVLLSGPIGIGKTQIAKALAMGLLKIESLQNQPYFRIVTPEKGTITIEQIRSLLGFFRLKVPGTAAIKRVALLEDADTMGQEAQNALLKLIEEPPADAVLLLTSSQAQDLLPTIRSRVQMIHIPAPEEKELITHFEAAGHDTAAIKMALLRSSGNVAEAEKLLTGSELGKGPVELVKQALGGTTYQRLLLVDGLAKQKEAAREFVDSLATIATVSLEAAARKQASSLSRWKDVLQAAYMAQDAFERNGNAKLVLTDLMLSL